MQAPAHLLLLLFLLLPALVHPSPPPVVVHPPFALVHPTPPPLRFPPPSRSSSQSLSQPIDREIQVIKAFKGCSLFFYTEVTWQIHFFFGSTHPPKD